MSQALLPDFVATVDQVAAALGVKNTSGLADTLASEARFGWHARHSMADLNHSDLRNAIAALSAKREADSASQDRPSHIAADGKICGLDPALWNSLSPPNRIAIYRKFQAEQAAKKPDSPKADYRLKRLESELHGARLMAQTMRGPEKLKQLDRIADLERQFKEAKAAQ
jgi:hypothetical protein